MYPRHLLASLENALDDTPVVLLNGARQVGKSTLAQALIAQRSGVRSVTLDDAATLASARSDPEAFIELLGEQAVIDEIQRAPELFLPIKASVDRDRRPGRFLLTGSADVLLLPRLGDSLAGRMEIVTLWPLSQGEILGHREGFIDAMFSRKSIRPSWTGGGIDAMIARIVAGGYPPAVDRVDPARRAVWYDSYLTLILQRDVRDLANIEGLTAMPRLLSLLAARVGSTLNYAELSRALGLPQTTLKRYMSLLETTFLVQMLPAWSSNLGKRLVRSPKLLLTDTGLAAHLAGLGAERLRGDLNLVGPLLENFVAMEMRRHAGWSRQRVRLYHFRTQTGQEVDLILENAAGDIVAIEVKAAKSIGADSFKGLRLLDEALGDRFLRGVVLYTGTQTAAFGKKLLALPVDALWEM